MAWPSFMEFYAQLPQDRLERLITNLGELPSGTDNDTPADSSMVHTALAIATHLLREYHEWLSQALERSS
ncbi:hypothetical protein [Sulfobacillus harzensis]|uniref:Uncharacterized protein n=1 Tax=Sulfobacillus harzensis TaxID=2729629 RepID=A0A7Y0L906_9FIRM|nr:hypothetical protein [Sulfobacillus harzensis]NMP24129.1 hypothetical protein [Sulfobacillus harzensis]